MYQTIVAVGRLGKDPELRYGVSGDPVCNFSLAVDFVQSGEKKTDWFRVVTFRKTAENCATYLTKGKLALVEGRLQIRDYEDKSGQKRTSVEIIASRVVFLSPGGAAQTSGGSPEPSDIGDDDVPF